MDATSIPSGTFRSTRRRRSRRPRGRRRTRQDGARASTRKTGKAVWTFTTRARVDSSPVVAGGRVYIGGNDGKLYVLDAATGKSVFEFEAGGPLSASPAIAVGQAGHRIAGRQVVLLG